MKNLIIILIIFFSGLVPAQSNFENGMQEAFDLWENNEWNEAENLFERIAKAEPTEWLPCYYIAQMNSLKSWTEKDVNILTAQLEKAQNYLDIAKEISPSNPEIMVLQAHVYTNWVAFDGAVYGMKYSQIVTEIYNKAYAVAPENPRVVYSKAEWGMGSARYFGQDIKPFCKDIESALQLFATFKPESSFHPNWGKERVIQVLETCK